MAGEHGKPHRPRHQIDAEDKQKWTFMKVKVPDWSNIKALANPTRLPYQAKDIDYLS